MKEVVEMFKISKEKQYQINQFLKNNIQKYPKQTQEYIRENIYKNELSATLLQLYSYKDAIIKELNPYYQFAELIKNKFNHLETKKITEVSCGFIPAASIALNKTVNLSNKIDVYDPFLINIPYLNINNHKTCFTELSEPKTDLLMAHLPCEALLLITKIALMQKKEMIVQTCKCFNGNNFSKSQFTYYIDSLIYQLKQLEDFGFIIETEKNDLSKLMNCPIILARKK